MQKADYWLRLMKQRTDALVASDKKLQHFLIWVSQKSLTVEAPHKPAAVRAFYFAVDRGIDRTLDQALSPTLDVVLNLALNPTTGDDFYDDYHRAFYPALDLALNLGLNLALERANDSVLDLPLTFVDAFDRAFRRTLRNNINCLYHRNPELRQALQQLKAQLPNPDCKQERSKQWWQANGQAWTSQLRGLMIKHRNIGHDWQFSERDFDIALDGRVFARARDHDLALGLGRVFARVLALALKSEIKQALQELKEQLPDPDSDWEIWQWWQVNGQAWTEQLRALMIKHRNIGHDWQLSSQQQELLQQYYEANLLLVNCLNSSFDVTTAVRSHIEDTLLLPIVEIEKRVTEMLPNGQG